MQAKVGSNEQGQLFFKKLLHENGFHDVVPARSIVKSSNATEPNEADANFVKEFLNLSIVSKRLCALSVFMHDVTERWLETETLLPNSPLFNDTDEDGGWLPERRNSRTRQSRGRSHGAARPSAGASSSDPSTLLRLYDTTLGRLRHDDRLLVRHFVVVS